MNVVCDTNVLISGVLFRGHSRDIISLSAQGVVRNFISPEILQEAEEVLGRPKFAITHEQVNGILQLFRDSFELVHPSLKLTVVSADPDDDKILEAALSADAQYIVSGDHHLIDLRKWKSIQIVSPAQFMQEKIWQQSD